MTDRKPTGYELTVDVKSMYLLCKLIGDTNEDRILELGGTPTEDDRLSRLFSTMKDKLVKDGNWYG